jgi:hypothetical protein
LTEAFELIVEGDPGAGHLRVHFTEPTFPNAAARAVTHELGAFGLERAVRNRRALMNAPNVLGSFFFSWNEDTDRHAA